MTIRGVVLAGIAVGIMAGSASAQLASPGFEQGPSVAVMSFDWADSLGTGWHASNTDGERILGVLGRPAAEGEYYASVLQNAGAYDGSPLGIANSGATGFDRIFANFLVDPSQSYTVSMQHAGDDRFGYLGVTSVIEIVDTDTNITLSQQFFATPGAFDWQTISFNFSAVGSTGKLAIALTTMGANNSSACYDAISIKAVPAPGALALLGAAGLVAGRRRR